MESVWDYPRPPALVPCERPVRIVLGGETIAESSRALRVLETSHPPTVYVPPGDFAPGALTDGEGRSFCEWKGRARYHDLHGGGQVARAAGWSYRKPSRRFTALQDFVCVYPSRVDACFMGDEQVRAQDGDFYGGWITDDIEGPFKGAPGTMGW